LEEPEPRERPAAAAGTEGEAREVGKGEKRGRGIILPSEGGPTLAETIPARYEPPRGIRRVQRIPLPVASQRAFEAFFAPMEMGRLALGPSKGPSVPGGTEKSAGSGGAFMPGGIPQRFVSLPGKKAGMVQGPVPSPRISTSFTGRPDISRKESEPLPAPVSLHYPVPEVRGEGAYRIPERVLASAPPKAKVAAGTSEVIARTAEESPAASAPRPGEGAAPAAGETGEGGPDMEAIAREVYAIIRRRLVVERERLGR